MERTGQRRDVYQRQSQRTHEKSQKKSINSHERRERVRNIVPVIGVYEFKTLKGRSGKGGLGKNWPSESRPQRKGNISKNTRANDVKGKKLLREGETFITPCKEDRGGVVDTVSEECN